MRQTCTILVLNFMFLLCWRVAGSFRDGGDWPAQPADARVVRGGSVRLRVAPLAPRRCTATMPQPLDHSFSSDPAVDDAQEYTLVEGETDRLRWLGGGECGIDLKAVSTISNGKWTLVSELESGTKRSHVTVSVIPLPVRNKTVPVTIGSFVTINCDDSSSTSPLYCRILSNAQEVASHACSLTLDPIKQEHIGHWTCVMALAGSMGELRHVVSLVSQASEHVLGEVLEDETSVRLQCSLKQSGSRDSYSWCRAVSPVGRNYLLTPGLVDGRYSAVYTDVKDKLCSLEIQLPLRPEDLGQWVLHLGKSPADFTGCFISLPSRSGAAAPALPAPPAPARRAVSAGSALGLRCAAPWPAHYCYVTRPGGALVTARGFTHERLLRVGECHVTATNVTVQDAGRWTCAISSNDGKEDILFYTDVEVFTKKLMNVGGQQRATIGASINMLCRNGLRRPLRYCRFISPQGFGFSLVPGMNFSTRLSYYGAGLEQGECGVKLETVTRDDIGTWTCVTSFDSYADEEFDTISLEKVAFSQAFVAGMSGGVVIICCVAISILTIKYRKRRAARIKRDSGSPSPSLSSDTPLTSHREISLTEHPSEGIPIQRSIYGSHH